MGLLSNSMAVIMSSETNSDNLSVKLDGSRVYLEWGPDASQKLTVPSADFFDLFRQLGYREQQDGHLLYCFPVGQGVVANSDRFITKHFLLCDSKIETGYMHFLLCDSKIETGYIRLVDKSSQISITMMFSTWNLLVRSMNLAVKYNDQNRVWRYIKKNLGF